MHIQEQSGKITDREYRDDNHQHYGHIIILSASPLSSFDGKVDLGIEKSDAGEGYDSQDKESGPIDIPGHIQFVHSE